MADNDVFRQGLDACWRKAYDAAKDGASPEEFVQLCKPALARFYQESGCPGFGQGRAMLDFWCVSEGELPFGGESYAEISAECDRVEQSYSGTGHATTVEYVMRAVRDIAFEAQMSGPHRGDAGILLAERVNVEIVGASLLARLDDTKVMETFVAKNDNSLEKAQDALYDWKEKAFAALTAELSSLAPKLAADPSGKTVKSREVRAPKRSTLELMTGWGRLDIPEPAGAQLDAEVNSP